MKKQALISSLKFHNIKRKSRNNYGYPATIAQVPLDNIWSIWLIINTHAIEKMVLKEASTSIVSLALFARNIF